jgi:hypothetical protein
MDRQQAGLAVLARIPCLNDTQPSADKASRARTGLEMLASTGRLIRQATSFRLLAGTVLFLLAAAIIPFVLNKKPPSSESPSTNEAVVAHRLQTSQDPVPDKKMTVGQTVARRPAIMVSAKSNQAAPPVTLPPPPDTAEKSPAGQAAELPTMSPWPSPAQPCLQQAEAKTPPDVDPSKTVRPVEYKADNRLP